MTTEDIPHAIFSCNYLYKELQDCYKEHPFRKLTGFCSPIFMELQRCIQEQQNFREKESLKRSKKFREKLLRAKQNSEAKED